MQVHLPRREGAGSCFPPTAVAAEAAPASWLWRAAPRRITCQTRACPAPPNPSSVHLQRPIPRQAVDRPRNPSRDSPMTFAKRCLFAFFALLLPLAAAAQEQGLEIDIIGGNASALPIAVVPMPYQGAGTAPLTDVSAVVRADLDRSGQFRTLPEGDMASRPTTGAEVDYPAWRALRQDFLVVGRVVDAAEGSYRVEYELFDVARQERLLGLAMTARANAMRDVAHQMADAIYEKILGVRGAFWTRIAYVTASGVGQNTRYALMVA